MVAGDRLKVWEGNRQWIPDTVVRRLDEPRSLVVQTPKGRYRRNSSFVRPPKAELHYAGGTRKDSIEAHTPHPETCTQANTNRQSDSTATVTKSGRVVKPSSQVEPLKG